MIQAPKHLHYQKYWGDEKSTKGEYFYYLCGQNIKTVQIQLGAKIYIF